MTEALVDGERVGFALREHYGLLELRLTNDRLHGLRRTWSDGQRQRLEKVLGGFVVGLGWTPLILTLSFSVILPDICFPTDRGGLPRRCLLMSSRSLEHRSEWRRSAQP